MSLQKIAIKFDNELYNVELPVYENFTGQIALLFHYNEGKLRKAEVHKNNSATVVEQIEFPIEQSSIGNR